MTSAKTDIRRPLRLWPGVVIVSLQCLARYVVPVFVPAAILYAVLAGFLGGLAILLWWAFFSRAPRSERWGAIVLMIATIAAIAATPGILHESIAAAAAGILLFYAVPILCLALVVWAVVSRGFSDRIRRLSMVATILAACGAWALVRTYGLAGDFHWDLAWRWSKSPEERLLAQAGLVPAAPLPAVTETAVTETGASDWPGFRGPHRDGVVRGLSIATDWSQSPPVELWRRPIGPGWSSFAVGGNRLYTQEQRGGDEVVSCYDAASGEPVWQHGDAARFSEPGSGAGPRGTPTLSGDRVYALGATGILNALDAADGSVVWSRDAMADTGAKLPTWGFAGSPLVVGDEVVVAASGRLAAYDLATGEPRWLGENGGGTYSSPQLLTIDGVDQVLLQNGAGVTSVAPADGALLWGHEWPGLHSLQPALTTDGDVLLSAASSAVGLGIRRIAVAHGPGGWSAEERWTSLGLKPFFNDFVVYQGHAYGFDGRILACIDLASGERKWKGGRYGNGQLVLLEDQGLLLVLSEKGELALVAASPDRFTELARFPALEGKTWNHPALAGDVLLARNGEEMAAFRLPSAGG